MTSQFFLYAYSYIGKYRYISLTEVLGVREKGRHVSIYITPV